MSLYVLIVGLVFVFELSRKASLFDPIIIFCLFYSLFVIPLPLRAYLTDRIEGDVTPFLPELYPYLPTAVVLCALGLIVLVVAYHSRLAWKLSDWYLFPPISRSSTGAVVAFIGVSVLSLAAIVLLVLQIGGLANLVLSGYGSTAQLYGRGYLAVAFPWSTVASLFLLYRYALTKRKRHLVTALVAFVLSLSVHLVMGRRGEILNYALAAVAFYHFAIRRMRRGFVVLLTCAMFIALNIYGFVRGSNYGSFASFVSQSVSAMKSLHNEGVLGKAALYTLTTGEFVVPFETLPQMLRSVGTDVPFRLGSTYLQAPVFYVPSALFSTRPTTLSNWYMREFYGGGFGLHEGRQFFFLAEAYLNFGVLGVFVVAWFWGLFLGALRAYRIKSQAEPGALLLYSLCLAFIPFAIAGESASLVVGLPTRNLMPGAVGLLIASRLRPWRRIRYVPASSSPGSHCANVVRGR
jgi:hypothetical protein